MHRYAPVFKGCGAADHCNSKRKHTLPRQLVGILVFCPVCFTAYACSPAGIVSRPAVEVRCVFGVESGGGGGGGPPWAVVRFILRAEALQMQGMDRGLDAGAGRGHGTRISSFS